MYNTDITTILCNTRARCVTLVDYNIIGSSGEHLYAFQSLSLSHLSSCTFLIKLYVLYMLHRSTQTARHHIFMIYVENCMGSW